MNMTFVLAVRELASSTEGDAVILLSPLHIGGDDVLFHVYFCLSGFSWNLVNWGITDRRRVG